MLVIMTLRSGVLRSALIVACLLLVVSPAFAGEKKMMHCFLFTAVESASDADWQAFFKATDELPGKIPGLTKVWYGKLERSFAFLMTDEATRKKLMAGEAASGPVTRGQRQWAACMEFADAAALKAYGPHPAHQAWNELYFKVRQPGTHTLDFMGK
jgi:hypothetical protein